jgi:enoyl-CoA hydratase/carnithine racemase
MGAGGTVERNDVGAVAVLTLAYPERRNALSLDLRAALEAALVAALADPAVRAIVLTGKGDHFCAGGDISGMEGLDALGGRKRLASAQRITRLLVEGEKPIVAAVEGFAVGAGLSLVAACDIVVAARTAKFACSFNRLGLVPDFGVSWTLPQRVGSGRARLIMLGGDTFDAETAERWGLVEILTGPGTALAEATRYAQHLAADTAPLSNGFAKALLARMPTSLEALLKAEADLQAILFGTADFAEGRSAFLAKRRPAFEGR